MALALTLYPAAVLFGFVWYQDYRWANFDAPFRFLLAAPLLLYLSRAELPVFDYYRAGCALGSIGAAGWAVWSFATGSVLFGHRAHSYFTNPIPFACIALVLGYSALPDASQRPRVRALMMVCALLGIGAAIASQSRAVLLVIPFSTILYLLVYRTKESVLRYRVIWLGVLSIALLSSIAFVLKDRIEIGFEELVSSSSGTPDSSIGFRRQLWSASAHVFLQHPVVGVGRGKLPEELKKLEKEGVITPAAAEFTHSHNEMLFLLSETGLLGAGGVAVVYLGALIAFTRRFSSHDAEIRSVAYAGLILVLTYIAFGLADCMLTQTAQTSFFSFSLVLLYAHMRQRERFGTSSR